MNRRLRSLLILPAVLLVASCASGGDSASDEAKPYVDAMTKSITADRDSPMNDKQARCFSEGFIDAAGLDKVKKAGTPREFADESNDLRFEEMNLTRDEGEEIYAQFDKCGVDLRTALLEDFLSGDEMTAEAKSCVKKTVTDDNLRDFLITMMVSGEDAARKDKDGGELMESLMGCMLGDLGGEE